MLYSVNNFLAGDLLQSFGGDRRNRSSTLIDMLEHKEQLGDF